MADKMNVNAMAIMKISMLDAIADYQNRLKKIKFKPVVIKGNECKTEQDIFGCYEADLINSTQYDAKLELFHKRNKECEQLKKDYEDAIDYMKKIIWNTFD